MVLLITRNATISVAGTDATLVHWENAKFRESRKTVIRYNFFIWLVIGVNKNWQQKSAGFYYLITKVFPILNEELPILISGYRLLPFIKGGGTGFCV